ncbi:MAG: hypothetical protein OXR66_01430 [Candidatus Woesearchaeota archaeon]|nr:hypothetical protein [Candidatus Woesearchaeota archaeon]
MRPYIVLGLICCILLLSGGIAYTLELERKPVVQHHLATGNTKALLQFYAQPEPQLAGRPLLGQATAPITIIAYLEPGTATTQQFLTETLPQLEAAYITPGRARFYYKQYLTNDAYTAAGDAYQQARTLLCAWQLVPGSFFALQGSGDEALKMFTDHGQVAALDACLAAAEPMLSQDVSEVEHLGMIGIAPRLYIGIDGKDATSVDGIPSFAILQQTIRQYEVQLGE